MITEKTVLSGTEEELFEYFVKKYDLVKKSVSDVKENVEVIESKDKKITNDDLTQRNYVGKPAHGGKVSTGIGNLFGGTSWGN
jgi:hypothetical protein